MFAFVANCIISVSGAHGDTLVHWADAPKTLPSYARGERYVDNAVPPPASRRYSCTTGRDSSSACDVAMEIMVRTKAKRNFFISI